MGRLPTAIENTFQEFFFDGGITAAKSFLKKNIPRDSTRVNLRRMYGISTYFDGQNLW